MNDPIIWLIIIVGSGLIIFTVRRRRAHRSAVEILTRDDETQLSPTPEQTASTAKPLISSTYRWVTLPIAVTGGLILYWVFSFPIIYSVTLSIILSIIVYVIVETIRERQLLKFEQQLADTVDLLVSSLRAGAGIFDALEDAVRESRKPLHRLLEEVLTRLRYGDTPARVFSDLPNRVSLESVRLFSMSLSVHWEVGGSLALSLSSVGRFIRDRVEAQRSVSTQGAQARASVLGVTIASYFIAAVIWQSSPEAMEAFLLTQVGSWLAACALVFQALGLLWMFKLSHIRY